jgi:hypothetical protein
MFPTGNSIMKIKVLCGVLIGFLCGCASSGSKTLHGLISSNQTAKAIQLINSGTIPDCDQKLNGKTPLYEAALRNQTGVIEALLQRGADPNRGADWFTPMIAAAQKRNMEALKILMLNKGDPKAQRINISLLDSAVMEIEPPGPVTDMLIDAGARPGPGFHPLRWQLGGGPHWAMASYHERKGNSVAAVGEYEKAAEGYAKVSREILGWAKRREFVQTPGGNFLFSLAVNDVGRLAGTALRGGNVNAYSQLESARTQAGAVAANRTPADVRMRETSVVISDPRIHPLELPDLSARGAKPSPPQTKRVMPPPVQEIIGGPKQFNESAIRQWALILAMYSEYCADKAEALSKK